MPDNSTPAAQSDGSKPAPGEFDFDKGASENPRIKRRSLKAKQASSLKPTAGLPAAARELEREAPPLSAEEANAIAAKPAEPAPSAPQEPVSAPSSKLAYAPPRVTPATAAAKQPSSPVTAPASASTGVATPKVGPASSANSNPAAAASRSGASTTSGSLNSTSRPAVSPHGTRPATLYYSTSVRKDKEASPTPAMKTTPTASPASTASVTATSASPARSSMASAIPRSAPLDYRANVERQSREQKSVGNILAYAVYGLIAVFLLSAGLAAYGAHTIFNRLNDQSLTVGELEQRYDAANKDLSAKLATTQQALVDAQAQVTRQQDLILKQQDELNRTLATANANTDAIRQERQARAQETATLRARVRDVENREGTTTQRY